MPVEAELIRDAACRVLNGETLVSIVNEWNDLGVRTTTAGPWHINALSALLIQPRLTPSILDQATHDRLVALRTARRKSVSPSKAPGRRYLLSGFLRCWRCGSRLSGTAHFGASAQPCYRCPSRGAGGCSGAIIRTDIADIAARDAIAERLDSPDFALHLLSEDARLREEEHALIAIFADALRGRPDDATDEEFWVGRCIDGRAWRDLKARLERWADARPADLVCRRKLDHQKELLGRGDAIAGTWEQMPLEAQRSVIEAVVDHFVVWPAGRRRDEARSERLEPVWKTSSTRSSPGPPLKRQ